MHVSTEISGGALYARNPYSQEFAERVAFFDVDDPARGVSGEAWEYARGVRIMTRCRFFNTAALNRRRLQRTWRSVELP